MIGLGAGAVLGNLALARVGDQQCRGKLFFGVGVLSGLTPILLGATTSLPVAMLAAAAVGASTSAFMTFSQGIVQTLAPDGMRGRVMSAHTWHTQGAMGGFNAVNGLLMDLPWMTVPLLFGGTGMLFAVLMLGSLLLVPLRALRPWPPDGGVGPLNQTPSLGCTTAWRRYRPYHGDAARRRGRAGYVQREGGVAYGPHTQTAHRCHRTQHGHCAHRGHRRFPGAQSQPPDG